MTGHTDPEMALTPAVDAPEDIPPPSLAAGSQPLQYIPSRSGYDPPGSVVASRRPRRSQGAWYAAPPMGHSIGLGYLVLTLREISGVSQSRLAARAGTSQPAIARLESGRQVPSVRTLMRISGACGMHLVVGIADPSLDAADLCLHDLTLLGVLRPNIADDLPDFFVIREPPPWAGEG